MPTQQQSQQQQQQQPQHFDVLILGAGIAGLSAAHHLHQRQFDANRNGGVSGGGGQPLRFAVLEAQNRYGGRLYTVDFGEGYVELGGSFCHGSQPINSVHNLAASWNLFDQEPEFVENVREGAFLHSSGTAINQETAGALYDEMKRIEYSTRRLPTSDSRSLEQYIDEEVERSVRNVPNPPPGWSSLVDGAVWNAKHYLAVRGGDATRHQVAWGKGLWRAIPSDRLIRGGYRTLLNRMVSDIGVENIQLNTEVYNIDWSVVNGGGARGGANNNFIRVTTNRGEYTARYVVVSFPLGVLKQRHQQLFTPQLPAEKVRVIESLGFGNFTRLYLQFDRPFWQPGTLNYLKFYPSMDDLRRIETKYGNQLVHMINGFEEVPTSRNVLLGWITSDHHEQFASITEDEVARQAIELLRIYTGDPSLPEPSRVLMSNWNTNPFILGTYSYPSLNTSSSADYLTLGEPLQDGRGVSRVHFIGEATHPYYYSAAHGSRTTGLAAAENIWRVHIASQQSA